ncbi:MAG: LysR family transcriptional regulator [Sphingobium sp.]
MNVRQLVHFRAILKHGGFSRAAAAINISQSALTQSIASLERELGVSLLERTQAGAKATAAGLMLHNRSEMIVMEIDRATAELREVAGATAEIRVGIDKNLSSSFIAGVLPNFLLNRRHFVVEVREEWADDLAPALVRGEFDLIISCLPGFIDDYNVVTERLFDKTVRALVRRDHPFLSGTGEVTDLADMLWGVRAPGPGGAGPVRAFFSAAGIPLPQKIIYGNSTEMMLRMVRSADLIAFLSVDLVKEEIEAGSIVTLPIRGLQFREPVYLAHHARSKLKPAAQQLRTAVVKAARELMMVAV